MVQLESFGDAQVDIHILEIFNSILTDNNNYFVDIGANDGITGSNSLLLEKQGWKGLLVEPNTEHKCQLDKIRKSPVEWCAISSEDSVTFNSVKGPSNLHGLSRIDSNKDFVEHVNKFGGSIESKTVPAMKLTDLLVKNKVPKDFAFLSIDVEGHELTAFKTLDFDVFKPLLIVTEDNSKGRNREVRDYLVSKGYELVKRVSVNEIYVQKKNSSKFFFSKLKTKIKYNRWKSKYFLKRILGIKDTKNYI